MNNLARKLLAAIGNGIDAKSTFNQGDWISSETAGNIFSSGRYGYDSSPGTSLNYAYLAGDLWQNSAVQAVLNWIIRAWPESYPCVKIKGDGGKKVEVPHPLTEILMNPNEWDDDTTLWGGTVVSFWCDGNAYWRIVRNRGGVVAEFEYVPHWAIMPHRTIGSNNPGPDFYRMNTVKGPVDIDPWDIVHFRFGKDPYNDLLGMSPWASVNREVYTDNEGCNYTATTLRNRGTAWMIVSPSAADGEIEDVVEVRDKIEARTTGDNRGRVVVLSGAVKVDHPGPMKDMGVEGLRKVPVGRICALAGIPPDCVDLGGANDHITFQNQEAAAAKGWNTIIQVQRMMGRQLTKQVLWNRYNYNFRPNTIFAGFDYSEVRALQTNKTTEWKRIQGAFETGLLTTDEAREEMGKLPYTAAQRQQVADAVHPDLPQPPLPPAPKPMAAIAAGNGNGKGHVQVDLKELVA